MELNSKTGIIRVIDTEFHRAAVDIAYGREFIPRNTSDPVTILFDNVLINATKNLGLRVLHYNDNAPYNITILNSIIYTWSQWDSSLHRAEWKISFSVNNQKFSFKTKQWTE